MRNLSRCRSGIAFPGLLLAFALSAAAAIGCMQKLDARSAPLADGNDGSLVTRIVPTANPISLDENDESKTTMDPCEKTRQDKADILSAYCAACHSGAAAVGLPPWNFVLDDQRLVTELWMREGQPSQRFVIPGDPDHSAIYERMAIAEDMPPQPTDVGTHANPRPSPADNSVIREWILHCLDSASGAGGTSGQVAGAGGAGGSGGAATGAGGMAGRTSTGGRGGAAGRATTDGGSRDGATRDGGTAVCATGVSAGGSCTAGSSSCELGQKTCHCSYVHGRYQWLCI